MCTQQEVTPHYSSQEVMPKLLEHARRNIRSALTELDIEDYLVEDRGKLFLLEYLDKTFTPDEKQVIRESPSGTQKPTVKNHPKAASFLREYNNNIYGHIPETIFQESHNKDYRNFLEKHMGITREKDATIAWELLLDSINCIILANLVPILKFINNDWGMGTRMHKYFNSNPKCPMCNMEENMEHVFSCNSATMKKSRQKALLSIKRVLYKNNEDLAQW